MRSLFLELCIAASLGWHAGMLASAVQAGTPAPSSVSTLETRVAALEARQQRPPKDAWDKLSAISGLASGLLVTGFGWWAANVYTRRQKETEARRNNLLTIEKFLPYLSTEDAGGRRTALAAISALGDEELAVRFASSLGGAGAVSALMEIAAGKGSGSAAANAELLRLFDGLMQRVMRISIDDEEVATGFQLGVNNYVGTDDILKRTGEDGVFEGEVRASAGRFWEPLSRIRVLPPDSFFRGEVLQLEISSGVSEPPALPASLPRSGDRVVILTRQSDGTPKLCIGRQTTFGITAELPPEGRGSPVFNEDGQFLGVLVFTQSKGNSTRGHLTSYEQLMDYASGGGLIITRIREDAERSPAAFQEAERVQSPAVPMKQSRPKRRRGTDS